MNDWQKWKEEQTHLAAILPLRIRQMRSMHGKRDDQKCGDCLHFRSTSGFARNYYKCELSKLTHGAGTDWRTKWPACGKWEEREIKDGSKDT